MLHWSRSGWIRTCLLVGGIILGSLLGNATVHASAARGATAPPPTAGTYCRMYVQALASNLHVSVSTLQTANRNAVTTTIQRAYNDHQISRSQENDLLNRVDQAKDPCTLVDRVVAYRDWAIAAHSAVVSAVATKLQMQPNMLEANLASGQTLAQIAASKGVSIADVNTTYLDAVQAQLNSAVQKGLLTHAQATKFYTSAQQAVAQGRYPLLEPHGRNW